MKTILVDAVDAFVVETANGFEIFAYLFIMLKRVRRGRRLLRTK